MGVFLLAYGLSWYDGIGALVLVASAIVGMTDHGVFDAKVCRPTPVAGFRVYPPDETASMYLALPNGGTGCAGETPSPQLRVTAIKAGPGQP